MNRFNRLPAFEREYRHLERRYRTLPSDIVVFESVLVEFPTGRGAKFVTLHTEPHCTVIKARLSCRTLRNSSLRIIYAWHPDTKVFVYLEIYYKGDKESEDRERIREYLQSL